MKIKRADNKHMAIHAKEKPKLHIKTKTRTLAIKKKGRNALVVQKNFKTASPLANANNLTNNLRTVNSIYHLPSSNIETKNLLYDAKYHTNVLGETKTINNVPEPIHRKQVLDKNGNPLFQTKQGKRTENNRLQSQFIDTSDMPRIMLYGKSEINKPQNFKGNITEDFLSVNRRMYAARYYQMKAGKERKIKQQKNFPVTGDVPTIVEMASNSVPMKIKTILDKTEGIAENDNGKQIYESYKMADTVPIISITNTNRDINTAVNAKVAGRNLYCLQVKKKKLERMKKQFAVKKLTVRYSPLMLSAASPTKVNVVVKSSVNTANVNDNLQSLQEEMQQDKKDKLQDKKKELYKKEKTNKKKFTVSTAAISLAANTTLNEIDGGEEVSEASLTAVVLAKPIVKATDAGKELYRSQIVKAKQEKSKKKQTDSKNRNGKTSVRQNAKKSVEIVQTTVREKSKATKTNVKPRYISSHMNKKFIRTLSEKPHTNSSNNQDAIRNHMIKLFTKKVRQEKRQENVCKSLKKIAKERFFIAIKHALHYAGIFLSCLFAMVAMIALPVIAVIAVVYSSPFAIFFPSISSGDTTKEVLSAYVSEFENAVNTELTNHIGYDTSEKVYVNFEGSAVPNNFYDILMVYMIKYGDGDTATDMTEKAKQNLKTVFDDMCSYTIASRTDTTTDANGNTTSITVKEVRVELNFCDDMVSKYGFNEKQQEVLAKLMNPEYLASIGYTANDGETGLGDGISPSQYQAVVDAISDENGRNVVAFALSKVGYPYSQAYRDSGNYYDCTSLAYYAWQNAGVNIMYEGSNTAASEGKFCYDNHLLVNYDEMQPGDLIFYSYSNNGRFMNISHVAIYVGDGKVVEAANSRIGVVYRPVQGRSSIVFIGRPR